jgi:hypothetical protein
MAAYGSALLRANIERMVVGGSHLSCWRGRKLRRQKEIKLARELRGWALATEVNASTEHGDAEPLVRREEASGRAVEEHYDKMHWDEKQLFFVI